MVIANRWLLSPPVSYDSTRNTYSFVFTRRELFRGGVAARDGALRSPLDE